MLVSGSEIKCKMFCCFGSHRGLTGELITVVFKGIN